MSLLGRYIEKQGFVVLDGALATELERHGADLADPLWSARCLIESPELITRVHREYLEAGADIITSSSYQASVSGFQARGYDAAASEALLRLSVDLALHARDDFWAKAENRAGRLRPLVAASMGPFGACLHDGSEYHGNYQAGWDAVADFHRDRLEVLARCSADLLAFETIPSLNEAEILLGALAGHPDQEAWLSFSCRNAQEVSHGEKFRDCARIVGRNAQIAAVGVNCTNPGFVSSLLESARDSSRPLVAYPNRGETWHAAENCWKGEGTESTDGGQDVAQWLKSGARIIGGCCRTGPADIAGIRAVLSAAVTVYPEKSIAGRAD